MLFPNVFNPNTNIFNFFRIIIIKHNFFSQYNDIQVINSFKNTIVSAGTYKYAPELHNVRVILLDKCVRGEEVTA